MDWRIFPSIQDETDILRACSADRASSPPTTWNPLDMMLYTALLRMLLFTLCSAVPFSVVARRNLRCVLQEDF
ncbi:hypothetical protein DPMN_146298 [Dreissena polymorpha]|uniref:Uncharacterized protein n=1 Tax=Dreissena polymorpha TaxID=45954 RepID=A0A9D4J1V1_DREPO|nr:hypothetical protein DPMN_146298 [Dreissena polymorpha]